MICRGGVPACFLNVDRGSHFCRPRTRHSEAQWCDAHCRRYTLPSQSHFYMETQNAVAEPDEGGTMRVWSSTQTMDGVQQAVSRVLGVPAHSVEVGAHYSAFWVHTG